MRLCAPILLLASAAAAQNQGPQQIFRDAVAAQQRGDYATAVREYKELLQEYPNAYQAHANLGVIFVRQGHFDEAIEQYLAALTGHESNADLRLDLALAYYKKPAYAEAARQFEILHSANLADARISMLLADCYAQLNQDDQALGILGPLENASPDDLAVTSALAPILVRTGHLQEGMERFEKVGRLGHSAQAYLLAGQTALKLSLNENARDDANAAIKLDPHLPGVYTLLGTALPLIGDNEGAVRALQTALLADPKDFEAQLAMGKTLRTMNDLSGARVHLERALQLRPQSAIAIYEMARIERAEGKIEDSVKDFEHVIRLAPNWAQPHIELSALYFRLNRQADGEREKAEFDRLNVLPPHP